MTWKTVGVSSPAILYILGIISSSPWEAVKVVQREPVVSEPCSAPATPASDCIWVTTGMEFQMFFCLTAAFESASAAIGEDGVMG